MLNRIKRELFLILGSIIQKPCSFFQEYLNERSIRGSRWFILKLIPKFNTYIKDLITPDVNITSYLSLSLRAVILSHAHLNHCGFASYLDESISVIASPETILILKAIKDTGSASIEQEVVYFSKRIPDAEYPYILKARPSQPELRGRTLIFTEDCSDKNH